MSKCKCCEKEISSQQMQWSGLCGLCDIGRCQKPSEYHKLEKQYEELLNLNERGTGK